jgi:hypothetical protein
MSSTSRQVGVVRPRKSFSAARCWRASLSSLAGGSHAESTNAIVIDVAGGVRTRGCGKRVHLVSHVPHAGSSRAARTALFQRRIQNL